MKDKMILGALAALQCAVLAAAQTTITIGKETAVPPEKTLAEIDRVTKEVIAARKADPKGHIRINVMKGADPDVAFVLRSMCADPTVEWNDYRPRDLTKGEPRAFRGITPHDGFVARGLAKLDQIAKTNAFDLVLFGDSITHYWENEREVSNGDTYERLTKRFSVLNIATAGNRVEHTIWYAEHGFLDGYRAKAMMLMIGTNNGGVPEVVPGVKRLLEIVREKQPDMVVFLSPIFPTFWDRFTATNKGLEKLCDGKRVIWCDFNDKLLVNGKATKEVFRDGIHLSSKGYEIWLREMMPRFEGAIGK